MKDDINMTDVLELFQNGQKETRECITETVDKLREELKDDRARWELDSKEQWRDINRLQSKSELHNKEIYGNGKKGLVTRVEILEKRLFTWGGAIIAFAFISRFIDLTKLFK